MKLVAFLCLIAVAAAAELPPIPILRQAADFKEDGTYSHSFESGNGIKVDESGNIKQIDPENAGTVARGSFSYTSPEGVVISTTWVADENGFQPSGAHLPVAPPMPDHVVKLLADLRAAGVL